MKTETRHLEAAELRVVREDDKPPRIVGHAAVFGKLSEDLMGFREQIKKGAFKRSLKEGADVRALINHDPSKVLGRTSAGTLTLKEDKEGLLMDVTPPDTQAARDLLTSIERGDITGQSFQFRTIEDQWKTVDGEEIRTLVDVDLIDVGPVTFPAYPDTTVAVRSLDAWHEEQKPKKREAAARRLRLSQ